MDELIEIQEMCKIYNPGENEVRALDHVNLTINKNEFVAIIAQYSGSSLRTNASLSVYEDRDDVSSWAYNSVCWAMTNRLLTTSEHLLRPGETVTRAELASALYSYDINLGARSTW